MTPTERQQIRAAVDAIRVAITPPNGNPGKKERAVLKACKVIEEVVA